MHMAITMVQKPGLRMYVKRIRITVCGMFLFGGRNRCVGSVRGRVSVLLATGGNKRGDGSTVKGGGVAGVAR
jgi:hypothetical protein